MSDQPENEMTAAEVLRRADSEEGSAPASGKMPRRTFLAISGLAAASTFNALPAMAGPFAPSEFDSLIPADKKLRPEWVRALYARGERTWYAKERDELRFIGMPVGGICCGTVYLGGDGKLWLWDIFNDNQTGILPRNVRFKDFGGDRTVDVPSGGNYVAPPDEQSPFSQGFAIRVNGKVRTLDARGWKSIQFNGEYPIGTVRYSDPDCPVAVALTAYSPFIPQNADDSGLPAIVCEFTLDNSGAEPVEVEIGGWLENAALLKSARSGVGARVNRISRPGGTTMLTCSFDATKGPPPQAPRSEVVVDNFDRADYGSWKVEGDAFGKGPLARADAPAYQGDLGGEGAHVVNSHGSAPANDVAERDQRTGKLTSPPILLSRKYLRFYIGGGSNVEEVGLRLLVDGKPVRRAAGHNDNHMQPDFFEISEFEGKSGIIEIYDRGTGGWGNIGVGNIVLTDDPKINVAVEKARDFGTMALALIGQGSGRPSAAETDIFTAPIAMEAHESPPKKISGGVTRTLKLGGRKSATVTYVVAWHFMNSGLNVPDAKSGNYYGKRFADAGAVAEYVAVNYRRLAADTKLWRQTWYDSTLPIWFLDRTFSNTSILATSTAHRFGTGRFWGWEGIGCCEGTCTHVWHYAQAVGRIFPEIERIVRERVDFGVGFDPATGMIRYRGEGTGPAVDGQCGRILGAYREHQMSTDDAFLRRIWPRVRAATEFMMRHDANGDGLLDGPQENTLDAAWFGKIAWLSSLFAAALAASEAMATDLGDTAFAATCAERRRRSSASIETQLFNGEYFIQRPEPGREASLGTYETCHIDQVHGQSWAWQVGLGRVLDREKTLSALRALYKYNFAVDVAPYRRKNSAGRPYIMAGEGGLIMATNPKQLAHAFGNTADWQYGYFNECMSGFEHQAASHMMAEGLTLESLAVTRAIHDRYHASRRNPFNEIECSDHYSRAMASYGTFVTACGFEHHGPHGHIAFAPRLNPENFRAPFTAAGGWGTFAQSKSGTGLRASIHLRWGALRLRTIGLDGPSTSVRADVDGRSIPASVQAVNGRALVSLGSDLTLKAGQRLSIALS